VYTFKRAWADAPPKWRRWRGLAEAVTRLEGCLGEALARLEARLGGAESRLGALERAPV